MQNMESNTSNSKVDLLHFYLKATLFFIKKEDAALAAQELQTESVSVAVPVIGAIVTIFVIGGIVFLVYKKKVKK